MSKLIADVAPGAIKENEIKNYFGRKVAIDASMSLYQVSTCKNFRTSLSFVPGMLFIRLDGKRDAWQITFFIRKYKTKGGGDHLLHTMANR